jgi:hypothetical protein
MRTFVKSRCSHEGVSRDAISKAGRDRKRNLCINSINSATTNGQVTLFDSFSDTFALALHEVIRHSSLWVILCCHTILEEKSMESDVRSSYEETD